MLKSLKNFFIKSDLQENNTEYDKQKIFCGIMIEAANIDGIIKDNEILKIKKSLIDIFKESPENIDSTIKECLNEINEPNSFHAFTSKINKFFEKSQKIQLLEILWEIILADGEIHDYESNLIRRLAGLMYISDIDCGNAKKRALAKIDKT